MRSTCAPVSASRDSTARARRETTSSWVRRSSSVRRDTSSSSRAEYSLPRRRSSRSHTNALVVLVAVPSTSAISG